MIFKYVINMLIIVLIVQILDIDYNWME